MSFRPYVPGKQPCITHLVKLNTNESQFGPSPLALEAMRAAAADTLLLYHDPEATELRAALAVQHGGAGWCACSACRRCNCALNKKSR